MECTHGGDDDRVSWLEGIIASSVIIGDRLAVVTMISSRCIIPPLQIIPISAIEFPLAPDVSILSLYG